MQKLKTLNHFKIDDDDVEYEMCQILNDPSHSMHYSLISDLNSLDQDDVELYAIELGGFVEELLGRESDKGLGKRKLYYTHLLHESIEHERKQLLISDPNGTAFYSKLGIPSELIDEGMVPLMKLERTKFDFQFELCRTRGSNSTHWLMNEIIKQSIKNDLNFKIRIDPLIKIPLGQHRMVRSLVYGEPLDWERVNNIRGMLDGEWISNRLGVKTDYLWHNVDNGSKVELFIEELPQTIDSGSRYFHAIFDKDHQKIVHCDGAIRFFTQGELDERRAKHLKHQNTSDIGIRIKVFKIDQHISTELFSNLAIQFFVWNCDVLKYFDPTQLCID